MYWRNFGKIFVSATEFCRRNKSHKFWLVFLGDLIVIFGRASPFLSYPGKSPWAVEGTDHQKSEAEWEGQKKFHYEKSMWKDAYSQKWQKYWIEVKEIHPTDQKEVTWEEETPPPPIPPSSSLSIHISSHTCRIIIVKCFKSLWNTFQGRPGFLGIQYTGAF